MTISLNVYPTKNFLKIHHVSITKTNHLMLHRKIITTNSPYRNETHSSWRFWPVQMRLLWCDEASDTNHPVTLWHIRQERRRHMHCYESVKAHPNKLRVKKYRVIEYSSTWCMPFTKQQFVIAHTIRQTEIPALLDGWLKYKLSVKMLCLQKKIASRKNINMLMRWSIKRSVKLFFPLSSVKLCVGGLRQFAVSWEI
jgi:hypothetical protein